MENLKELCNAYLGQDMEEEYQDTGEAVFAFFENSDRGDIEGLIQDITLIQSKEELFSIFQSELIEWHFGETDDEIRDVLQDLANSAKSYLED